MTDLLEFMTTERVGAAPVASPVQPANALPGPAEAAPAAPNAYETLSESAGLEGWEFESIRTHVIPPSSETSMTTDASGLPFGGAWAAAPMPTCWKTVADGGGDRVTAGGCGGGVGVGVGAFPTGPPPPAFSASVDMTLSGLP